MADSHYNNKQFYYNSEIFNRITGLIPNDILEFAVVDSKSDVVSCRQAHICVLCHLLAVDERPVL